MTQFTKRAIVNSFIKLLNEKPLDKITIKDIVEDCNINRNTFYYHFQDISALVIEILNSETEKVISERNDINSWEDGFIAAAKFALDNKRAIYHLYNSIDRDELERYLNTIAREVMNRYVSKVSENINVPETDKELIINFYKCALAGLVQDWLINGMKSDPEKQIRRLGKLLEGNIIISLKQYSR